MSKPSDTARIEALESALAHQDKLVEDLNGVLTEQWATIDRMKKEMEHLRDRLGQLEYETRKSPTDEAPPPHY